MEEGVSTGRCANARLRLVVAVALGMALSTGAQSIDEYQLKAACLFNLAKFVEWPPETFNGPDDSIVTCILGDSPLGIALEQGLKGRMIDRRPLITRRVAGTSQVAGCQILFVSASERMRSRAALGEFKTSGILTVGETDWFISEGGVVAFKLEGGKVRIQISTRAAERERLRISSRLLSLAQIVGDR